MYTTDLIRDLYAHMEWADARVWNAVAGDASAASDEAIRLRLFHIHHTQRVFMQVWEGQPVEQFKPDAFPTLKSIYEWAQSYYLYLPAFLNTLDEERLKAPLPVPWAGYFGKQLGRDPAVTTLGETLVQVPSHSVHHRAQVNVQLREHGAEPPLIDFIVWIWSGRPAPGWMEWE